jgi:F-type H+-transporting ATPase subunit c
MRKSLVFVLTFLTAVSFSALAWAAEPTITVSALETVASIASAAALAIGLGVTGPALAQGIALFGTTSGISRNPEAAGSIRLCMLIGLAIMESLAIYALVVALILIYAFPFNAQLLKLIS